MDSSLLVLTARVLFAMILWVFVVSVLGSIKRNLSAPQFFAAGSPAVAAPAPAAVRGGKPRTATIINGPLRGAFVDLSQATSFILGRDKGCDLVITDDFASSQHARLFFTTGHWFIEDLESRNGTWVGGHKIDQPEAVEAGSDMIIGQTTVRLLP